MPEQRRASAQWPASGLANDDTVAEWQTVPVCQTVREWKMAPECQTVREWKTVPTRQTVPEWQTDAWKHRVEGEARRHLNAEIAGVGRLRS